MNYKVFDWENDKEKGKLLNVLLTNRSFAVIFEGDNLLYPVGQIIKIHNKKYQITKFEKMEDMIEVKVVSVATAA